jgi:hypothetical protein
MISSMMSMIMIMIMMMITEATQAMVAMAEHCRRGACRQRLRRSTQEVQPGVG